MDMRILVDDQQVGFINQRSLKLHKTFEYTDKSDKLVCTATKTLIGTHYEVTDANGSKIGNIDKERWKSAMNFGYYLSIKDSQGNVVAQSKQTDFIKS